LAEREFLLSLEIAPEKVLYEDLYTKFMNFKQSRIKGRSILTYRDVHEKHILPEFGSMVVSQISKDHIRRWQRKLLDQGYSNGYLKSIQANFKRVLAWGLNHDIIHKNPFTTEIVKRIERRKEMLFFTLEEYELFAENVDDIEYGLIFDILYWCGIRKGELQALKFSDIDLENRTLKVSKNFDYRNHRITTPKNLNSYREVMLTTQLVEQLDFYINYCKRIAGYNDDLFLFGLDKPIACTTLERKKNEYCRRAGVKKIRIHDFRHSHVSLLVNSGINDFDIAKRLGHSRDMVNNIYGHWFKKNQINLVNKLDIIVQNSQEKHRTLS
jgi:integrase